MTEKMHITFPSSQLLLILLLLLAFNNANPSHGGLLSVASSTQVSAVTNRRTQELTETDILMQIKAALDPDGKILKSWVLPGGSFEGVAWNGEGKVANISLQGRGLTGFIPSAIAELSALTGLYLHYNKLHGSIPTMLYKLSGLTDLYLNVNLLSGTIPSELGLLYNLQALQLCCNALEGVIPMEIGELKQLNFLALQHNKLVGEIPSSLGYLADLTRLDLSFNQLNGTIPTSLGNLNQLTMVDVSSNLLSGPIPPAMRRLQQAFTYENNSKLCGEGFTDIRSCDHYSLSTVSQTGPDQPLAGAQPPSSRNNSSSSVSDAAESADPHLLQKKIRLGSKTAQVAVVSGVVAFAAGGVIIGLFIFILFRRHKQKISSAFEMSDTKLGDHHYMFSSEQKLFAKVDAIDASLSKKGSSSKPPPVKVLDHGAHHASASTSHRASRSFGSFSGVVFFNGSNQSFQYDLEELEMATNFFSDKNLLGKRGGHSAVYRGVLRDGSCAAIRTLHKASCRTPGLSEFKSVVGTIAQLRHENIVSLKGFCFSSGKAECFLVYDFVTNGTLQEHLDTKRKGKASSGCLDWSARARIANNIARGLQYMHRGTDDIVVHQNVSAANVLLDQNYNAFLSDAGLHRLLADDIVFSALKSSAARGYLAPEYVTTGRLTEKSDVYAFGVLLLQLLTGKRPLFVGETNDCGADVHHTGSGVINMVSWGRSLVGAGCIEELMDPILNGKYSCAAATHMAAVAFACTHEDAVERPDMVEVVSLLQKMDACAETMLEAGLSSGEDYPRRQQALFAERLLDDGR